jgi:hypothetical protein
MSKKPIEQVSRTHVEKVKNGAVKDKPNINIVSTAPPPAPKPKDKK